MAIFGRAFIAISVGLLYMRAEFDVNAKKDEGALKKLQKAYRIAVYDTNLRKAPIELNVMMAVLAISTNNLLLFKDLAATIGDQIQANVGQWNEQDRTYLGFYSRALLTYRDAWMASRGVEDPNPSYVRFDKSRVSPRLMREFPLAEDGRLR